MLVRLEHEQDIALADAAPFELGCLRVNPPLLQVTGPDAAEYRTLEPRVMQVLVHLARNEGQVVSRQDLLDHCWDGRIVGDNAIHRVMSRLRALASETTAFTIETIPRVGYRLQTSVLPVPQESPVPHAATAPAIAAPAAVPPPSAPATHVPRRMLLGAGLGAGLMAAAGLAAWRWGPTAAPAAADRLLAKAREALLYGLPDRTEQAVAFLDQAIAVAPDHGQAWGALAMALNNQLEQKPGAELPLIASRCAAAARRALAIDPANVEAHVALATIRPNFRRWQANEEALLALEARFGRHPAIDSSLGWLLCDVGRWREAVVRFRAALAAEPFHPHNRLVLALGVWGQGGLAEADQLLAESARLWPRHPHIWLKRYQFLLASGRAAAALAMVRDEAGRPVPAPGETGLPYRLLDLFAVAMQTRRADDIARASAAIEQPLAPGPMGANLHFLAALGRIDDAFAWLERAYFDRPGPPDPSPFRRRKTSTLFYRSILQRDPRHGDLLRRVGITAYWRATGTGPDIRP